ncbi:HMG-Y-related protein A [Apium graveolens]|uniref:HMG-Y-related protein A n=1 Tax=Apium graveolens TaxID=4045 RepID=UPI003D7B691F
MATGEAAPALVPTTLPQYPELILAAIEAVDDKNGANKTTISKHIESIYGQLPAAHSTLLSHHLNRMKQSGELLLYKNNYLKPDPNAPPRRGRGRPPKEKSSPSSAPASDAVVSPPRPRGRPPKVVDPDAPAMEEKTKSPSVSGRKRGRPKKSESSKRGRGRPPKEKTPAPAATAEVGA